MATGWEGIHLYAFDIYAVQYGSFELMMASPRVSLTQFTFWANDKVSYTYDMGDGWVHEVRVESLLRGWHEEGLSRVYWWFRSLPI